MTPHNGKTEKILELAYKFPFISVPLIIKHVENDKGTYVQAKSRAYTKFYRLIKRGELILIRADRVICVLNGKSKVRISDNLPHNEALISFLMNLYLKGYEVEYSGTKNKDGLIGDDIAVECDRLNTRGKRLEHQVTKYSDEISKILYISFPNQATYRTAETRIEPQIREMESLMRSFQKLNLPRRVRKKLFFSTYIEASNPLKDTLKEKIWRKLDGRIVSVI